MVLGMVDPTLTVMLAASGSPSLLLPLLIISAAHMAVELVHGVQAFEAEVLITRAHAPKLVIITLVATILTATALLVPQHIAVPSVQTAGTVLIQIWKALALACASQLVMAVAASCGTSIRTRMI